MDIFTAIEERRSIKHFNANVKMSELEFDQLMSNVILSPTSYNIQNWRFIRVTDKLLRVKLREAAWGQSQVEEASELLILCADLQAYQDRPERYWANADQATQDALLPMIEDFHSGKVQAQRDEGMRSCGIAAQTIMLAAKGMGYDTCAMVGFDESKVAELIKLPEHCVIAMMVVIGKAEHPAHPRGGQLSLDEVLMIDTF